MYLINLASISYLHTSNYIFASTLSYSMDSFSATEFWSALPILLELGTRGLPSSVPSYIPANLSSVPSQGCVMECLPCVPRVPLP